MSDDALGGLTEGLLGNSGELPLNLQSASIMTIFYNVAVLIHPKVYVQPSTTLDPQKGELPLYRLQQAIRQAEARVSRKLGQRYVLPLAANRDAFLLLPDDTQVALGEVVDREAAAALLEERFGANAPTADTSFAVQLRNKYEKLLEELLDMNEPPLAGLTARHGAQDDALAAGVVHLVDGYDNGVSEGCPHPADIVRDRLPII